MPLLRHRWFILIVLVLLRIAILILVPSAGDMNDYAPAPATLLHEELISMIENLKEQIDTLPRPDNGLLLL